MTGKPSAQERAIAIVRAQSTERLVESFEMTETIHTPEATYARKWIMDELERRNESAFTAWLDSNTGSPRAFYLA